MREDVGESAVDGDVAATQLMRRAHRHHRRAREARRDLLHHLLNRIRVVSPFIAVEVPGQRVPSQRSARKASKENHPTDQRDLGVRDRADRLGATAPEVPEEGRAPPLDEPGRDDSSTVG